MHFFLWFLWFFFFVSVFFIHLWPRPKVLQTKWDTHLQNVCPIDSFNWSVLCLSGLSEPTTFGTFSGKDVPSQIASNGHIMRLEFQSDHSNTGKGFNISYTSMFFFSLSSLSRSVFWWNKKRCDGVHSSLTWLHLRESCCCRDICK